MGTQQGPQRPSVPGVPLYDHSPNLQELKEDLKENERMGKPPAAPLPRAESHTALAACYSESSQSLTTLAKLAALPHVRSSFMTNQMQRFY